MEIILIIIVIILVVVDILYQTLKSEKPDTDTSIKTSRFETSPQNDQSTMKHYDIHLNKALELIEEAYYFWLTGKQKNCFKYAYIKIDNEFKNLGTVRLICPGLNPQNEELNELVFNFTNHVFSKSNWTFRHGADYETFLFDSDFTVNQNDSWEDFYNALRNIIKEKHPEWNLQNGTILLNLA